MRGALNSVMRKARTVVPPTDPLEREADLVAEQLTGGPPCPCALEGKTCSKCAGEIHRKGASSSGEPPGNGIAPSGGGTPLGSDLRKQFEAPLGIGLGGVRVHTGREASRMAADLDALAFTAENHIVFAEGAWAPGTQSGRRLLAHELAHVRQNHSDRILRQPAPAQTEPAEPEPKYQPPPAPVFPANADVLRFGASPMLEEVSPLFLTADEEYLGAFVRHLIAQYGTFRANDLASQLGSDWRDQEKGPSWAAKRKKIYLIYSDVLKDIAKEQEEFCDPLEEELRAKAYHTLDDSALRLHTEMIRYGVVSIPGAMAEEIYGGGATMPEMASEGASVNLAAAAQMLLTRREEIDHLSDRFQNDEDPDAYAEDDYAEDTQRSLISDERKRLSDNYNRLYAFFIQRFPILGDFGDLDSSKAGLRLIASGPSPQTAELIATRIAQQLDDIETTRRGLEPGGEGDVWALDRLVKWVSAEEGVGEFSIQARWIEEKVADEHSGFSWKNIALGVLGFAGAILAPVTFGLSLVGTAAISTYQAYESYRKYKFEMAAAHTVPDRARAISAGEPSFFWVALDILFAIADVGMGAFEVAKGGAQAARLLMAQRIYKGVLPEVRAVQAGEALTEDAKNAIRQAAGEGEEAAAAAENIIHHLESGMNEGGALKQAFGLSDKEVEALFSKSGAVRREIAEEELETIGTAAAGRVKITKSGQLWVCASPCMLLREKYADVLASNEFGGYGGALIEESLGGLEKRAMLAAEAGDAQELFEVARDASSMEAALRAGRTAERAALLEKVGELRKLHPKLGSLSDEAWERILAKGADESQIKGQLHEELQNLALTEDPAALHEYVPSDVVEQAGKGNIKLEYIPGHAVLDAAGNMLTDGLIGYWKDGRFQVVTVFEA
ncbi:MAG: DUF4157 domain-containing protein [Bryobacteraceae bacterium]